MNTALLVLLIGLVAMLSAQAAMVDLHGRLHVGGTQWPAVLRTAEGTALTASALRSDLAAALQVPRDSVTVNNLDAKLRLEADFTVHTASPVPVIRLIRRLHNNDHWLTLTNSTYAAHTIGNRRSVSTASVSRLRALDSISSSNSTNTTEISKRGCDDGCRTGVIVGSVLGFCIIVAIIILCICCLCRTICCCF